MKNGLFRLPGLTFFCPPDGPPAASSDRPLAHMVYFTLKEQTAANRQALIADCHKYLADHEGVIYFSAGELCTELRREVNDLEFDVALNVVFKNKAAHDAYQQHPEHMTFIERNKPTWAKVRVFDSYLS